MQSKPLQQRIDRFPWSQRMHCQDIARNEAERRRCRIQHHVPSVLEMIDGRQTSVLFDLRKERPENTWCRCIQHLRLRLLYLFTSIE